MNFAQVITNLTTTANGALTHKSTLSACLDLFSKGVSASMADKQALISKALIEDPITATKVVFYLRDCRGGQGNKDIARAYHNVVLYNLSTYPEFFNSYLKNLPYLPAIGSWKDVYALYGMNKQLDTEILNFVATALHNNDGLTAKWFPRQSQFHKDFAKYLGLDVGVVRRKISSLTKVVETQMCNKQWHEIEYRSVPSVANKLYSKAFARHDSSRYQQYLDLVTAGTTTMKSAQLYPHEILAKGTRGEWDVANAMWTAYPSMPHTSNILPIIDFSSSMTAKAYSNYSCMDIAAGLGIYLASQNTGTYKDLWCNFDTTPTFFTLSGTTLQERYNSCNKHNWGGSTDFNAVFEHILSLPSGTTDLPAAIICVSDMHFNSAGRSTNFQAIDAMYQAKGLTRPTLIFWRVDSGTSQVSPVTKDEHGTILINGYSPAILKLILSLDIDELASITPLTMMHKALAPYTYIDTIFS